MEWLLLVLFNTIYNIVVLCVFGFLSVYFNSFWIMLLSCLLVHTAHFNKNEKPSENCKEDKDNEGK